ncbi:MAG: EAL domain-containing protein [Treponema sp.]|nr:EAL domain-containing protein [Treponema sp.]
MLFNFDYTVSFLFILVIFLLFYFIKPKLSTRTNINFVILLFCEICTTLLQLITQGGDYSLVQYPYIVFIILECVFAAMFLARSFMVFYFFMSLCEVKITPIRKKILIFINIIFALLIIASSICFIFNYFDTHPITIFLIFTIVPCFFYIHSLLFVIKKSKAVGARGLVSSALCIITLITAEIFSGIFDNYIPINLVWLFVIIILFLSFENPDNHIDARTGFFIRQAFHTYIRENQRLNRKSYYVGFVIKNYIEKRMIYGEVQMDQGLTEIGKCLKKHFPHHKWFYLRDGHFIVVCKDNNDADVIKKFIKDRFSFIWRSESAKLYLNIAMIELVPEISVKSSDNLLDGLRIAFADAESLVDGDVLYIDQAIFDEMGRRSKVRKVLDSALQNNEIQLYLQPIIDSKTRKIIAAEALSRLYDEELGVIPPVDFIDLAEKNGNIETLGEQILQKTCEFITNNDIQKLGLKWINVNLSPVQCQNSDLPERISAIAKRYSVSANHIHLEVTEESMIDVHILSRQMKNLISYGYDISLDDYGSGFSNIVRVKRFPFNNIKLDMGIVWEHFKQPDNILPSIVGIFKERGLSVTAEGVETKDMADALQNMGCTYLQGFYFSKPVPASEFLDLVRKQNLA